MRLIPSTWTHVRRSPYQALAAILTMFLTFLLGGVFFLASVSSVLVLQFFESKPQITVFFTDKASADDAKTLEKTLDATGKVSSMKYVSKDDALAIYREQNKGDPLLLEMVTADILPASLEVSAKDPTYLGQLSPIIQKAQGVEEVVFQKDVVDTLLSWTNAIRLVGGSLAILLAIDSLLIIMTVVSMKIALKKEEIEILKLIGASPWYIRMPFVMEGGFYGATGAVMAWSIITGLVIWLRPTVVAFLGMIPAIGVVLGSLTEAPFLLAAGGFMGVMLIVGFFLGSVGSLVALGRYLKF
jgi:cell division transport system permease protein